MSVWEHHQDMYQLGYTKVSAELRRMGGGTY